jgi:hypothetical protein
MGYSSQTVRGGGEVEVEKCENSKIFYGGIDVYGVVL